MKKVLLSTFLFLTITSCKKENLWFDNTKIYGIVADKYSKQPINGIWVRLYKKRSESAWFNAGEVLVNSNQTKDDGNYEIKFSAKDNKSYFIRISEDTNDIYFMEEFGIKNKEKVQKDIALAAKSSFALKVINTNPFDDNDQINIGIIMFGTTPFSYEFKGKNTDTTLKKENVGGTAKISWRITKKNIVSTFQDSIECPPNNYNEFKINY